MKNIKIRDIIFISTALCLIGLLIYSKACKNRSYEEDEFIKDFAAIESRARFKYITYTIKESDYINRNITKYIIISNDLFIENMIPLVAIKSTNINEYYIKNYNIVCHDKYMQIQDKDMVYKNIEIEICIINMAREQAGGIEK